MNSQLSKTIFDASYRNCPFLSFCRRFGFTSIFYKVKNSYNLCPYIRTLSHEDNLSNKRKETEYSDTNSEHNISELFNYERFLSRKIQEKRDQHIYRVFYRIGRLAHDYPYAESYEVGCTVNELDPDFFKVVTVWCSNDYLGMSRHKRVVGVSCATTMKYGVGSGGTRNISGNSRLYEKLERTLASWYEKEAGLLFTSCYVANVTTLSTIGRLLPNCVIFSDQDNHASMIDGISTSRCEKHIFKHNNSEDLERLLKLHDSSRPKIVAFESVNSMSGSISPIKKMCDIAHQYGAITFLDEVHAVGLYGYYGSGVSEQQGCLDSVDIISGTLGKAVGTIGGFIVGKSELVDMIRSYGAGLIFTTSLPPNVISASTESIKILQSEEGRDLRRQHNEAVVNTRKSITQLGFPLFPSVSHIIPLHVGNSDLCSKVSKYLMDNCNLYVQAINYPTVRSGSERLRIAPTPGHSGREIKHLVESLVKAWDNVGLTTRHPPCCEINCKCNHICGNYLQENPHVTIPQYS